MLEKRFNNTKLGIELTSYIDNKQNIWFQGKDVAKILGYSDTDQAIRKHVDEEDKYKGAVETTKQRVLIGGKKYYNHPVFSNYAASKNGEVINVKTGKIMRMSKNGNGYLKFSLYDKKLEKPYSYSHHRFVFEVFKGLIPRCLEIDHINNCKKDNRIKNLQLLTRKQNVEKSHNKAIISINIENGEKKNIYFY